MEDHAIITLYWDRDEAAIRETKNKYGRYCRRIAMNILSVPEDAEECMNDLYHQVWNTIPPERPVLFRAWLGKIARNLSINYWNYNRAQKRYAGMEVLLSELIDCIPENRSTEEILETRALSRYISDWLDTLPVRERALFVRRYWNCEQIKQLAAISGTTPNKLAGKMFRLRKSLRAYLVEKGVAI